MLSQRESDARQQNGCAGDHAVIETRTSPSAPMLAYRIWSASLLLAVTASTGVRGKPFAASHARSWAVAFDPLR